MSETLKVDVLDAKGNKTGTAELPAEIFDAQANVALLHQVVTAQLAAARIPHAALCQLEGADHLLMLGPRRDEVKKVVTGFLKEHLLDVHPSALPDTSLGRAASAERTTTL